MPRNRNFLIIVIIFFGMIFNVDARPATNKLIVFHFDFNSVTLQKSYVMKWIKKASEMGYNAILWEVEDEIKWETCPECASADAFTKKEFKEILDYSRELGLEPIPLLQTIGHGEYVLQHNNYFKFREESSRYDCYCTSNANVQEFLRKWIKEYVDLFAPLKYFHLGGDEAYAFATCDECKTIAHEIGESRLYADHLIKISEPLREANIRPGVWSDMMLSYPDQIEAIPKDFIIWDWNYWDGDISPEITMIWGKGRIPKAKFTGDDLKNFPEIVNQQDEIVPFYTADVLNRLGYEVILSSTSRSHGDAVFIGRNNLHVDNIYGAAKKTNELGLFGTCVTSWAVRIPNYETQEPWFHIAPVTISNPDLKKTDVLKKISLDLFGIENTNIYEALNKVGYPFPFVMTNTTGIMWTGLKDSKAAPFEYINGLIKRWKENGRWQEQVEMIRNSSPILQEGINLLNAQILESTKGYDILHNYSKAAYFQYWQSIIANAIVDKEEMKSGKSSKEVSELINTVKRDYTFWAKEWMTDASAVQNAGLIYDALQNYFITN